MDSNITPADIAGSEIIEDNHSISYSCNSCSYNDIEDDHQARRKTWNELRGVVSDLRRRMSGMSAGSVPGSVTFRSLPDGR